jgi:hypothetical protein
VEIGDLVGFVSSLRVYDGFEGKTGIVISIGDVKHEVERDTALSFTGKNYVSINLDRIVNVFRSDGRMCRLLKADLYVISKRKK